MKKVLSILAAVAAVATIMSLALQIWPEPEPSINVLVEERRVGSLLIRAVTDEGRPIAAGQVQIRPQKGASHSIHTQTNSEGELEIRAEELMSYYPDDGPEGWDPDSEAIRDRGVMPVYVTVSQAGYATGEMWASIDVR